MNDVARTSETSDDLEVQAGALLDKAAKMRAKKKAECPHPLQGLDLTQGAVSSYNAAYDEQEIYIRCKLCDAHFSRYVRFHHGD